MTTDGAGPSDKMTVYDQRSLLSRIAGLEKERDEWKKEAEEQARLLGIGGSKEAALLARLEESRRDAERLAGSLRICDHSGRCIDDAGSPGPDPCDRCEALAAHDSLKGERGQGEKNSGILL